MTLLYFFLGNTPQLSLLELSTLYPGTFAPVGKGITSYSGELEVPSLTRLGGTRKVAQELVVVSPRVVESELINLVTTDQAKNVAVTDYSSLATIDLKKLKREVAITRPIRLVSMETFEHELLMLSSQHVSEFNLLPHKLGIAIAKTVWIHDSHDWVTRDRGKPYRNIKHGMLPPKLARIMVNLAVCGKRGLTLADPFCGTGTILAEGLLTGCRVIGSDTDKTALSGATANCAWLCDTYSLSPTLYSLELAEAVRPPFIAVEAIATEPYMGPLLESHNPQGLAHLKNIAKGLDKLYRGSLRAWHARLSDHGRVVISLPSFVLYNRTISTIPLDAITALGYNVVGTVPYGKPGATVVRNITILERK